MKKILTMVLMAGLAFTSCEDQLDSTEYTKANVTKFPARPIDVNSELAGLYTVLNQIQMDPLQFPFYQSNMMSDDCNGAGGYADNIVKSLSHMTMCNNDQYAETWKLVYRAIFRANSIIETIDVCDWKGDTEARNQALGEAYFMRALFGFWGTQTFGDIPFPLTSKVPDPCPQVSADTVIYPQLITDLVSASELMSASKHGSADGHATKWAAEALLARVYMFYQGFYKNAGELANANLEEVKLNTQEGVEEGQGLSKEDVIAYLKDCIDNSGHELVGDYRNLWQYTNKLTVEGYSYTTEGVGDNIRVKEGVDGQPLMWAGNGNIEEMFQIQFMNANSWNSPEYKMSYANNISLFAGLRCDTDENGAANGGKETFPFGQGWGQGVSSGTLWEEWTTQESTDGEDIRKTASILDCLNELENYAIVTTGCEDACYSMKKFLPVTPYVTDDKGTKNDFSTQKTWWSFLFDGFSSSNGNDMQGSHFNDIILIRFADVLLMHTELTGDATYMNQVRARAGLSNKDYSWKNIQDERRWELAFEGLRYQDLRRWSGIDCDKGALICTALDNQKNQMVYNRGEMVSGLNHMTSSWSDRYVATNGFLPKPKSQIDLSKGTVTQNAGWNTEDATYKSLYE